MEHINNIPQELPRKLRGVNPTVGISPLYFLSSIYSKLATRT
jgi:hypothetical protein